MNSSDYISMASAFAAAAALAVAVWSVRLQRAATRHGQLFQFVSQVLDEFHEPKTKEALKYLTESIPQEYPIDQSGRRNLSENAIVRIRPLTAFFNEIGLMIATGALESDLISSLMGKSITKSWAEFRPYVYAQRIERSDPNYYAFFEHAAACMSDIPLNDLNRRLKLRRCPAVLDE